MAVEGRPVRLLVVEEDTALREAVTDVLADDPRFDPELLHARSGEEAADLALAHAPDAALVDSGLPLSAGLDTLRELRRLLPDRCLILVTAAPEVTPRAHVLPGDDAPPRTVRLDQLPSALERLC